MLRSFKYLNNSHSRLVGHISLDVQGGSLDLARMIIMCNTLMIVSKSNNSQERLIIVTRIAFTLNIASVYRSALFLTTLDLKG